MKRKSPTAFSRETFLNRGVGYRGYRRVARHNIMQESVTFINAPLKTKLTLPLNGIE